MDYLENLLKEYHRSEAYPFHMPGHKRQGGPLTETDLTEIDGFDNLHHAEGILFEEMERAAAFYKTRTTRFLINGSTCGLLTAISAAVPRGGHLLMDRGAHIAAYHAAYLRDLEISYLPGGLRSPEDLTPEYDPTVSCSPENLSSEYGHAENCSPDAVLITSPSYEGCVRDVAAWAEWAHHLGAVLIVDEAHGAHFSMHPYFPKSAVHSGADLVIQSTHKTLPALTQTALLHNVTGRISEELLDRFLRIYETSSPSYLLMSSITTALHACMEGGSAYFETYVSRLKALRGELSGLSHLRLAGGAQAELTADDNALGYPAGTPLDPGKLTILTGNSGLGGSGLYDLLRLKYRLQPEMKSDNYVLLMTSVADTETGFSRLITALREIDQSCSLALHADAPQPGRSLSEKQTASGLKYADFPPAALRLSQAWELPYEALTLSEALGRVCADFVVVYPPDSPLIVPGEYCTAQALAAIGQALNAGLTVTGLEQKEGQPCIRCLQQ